ncbi:MAG: hypothetical protein H7243_04985 [Sphingomonadaceae bacterium]|nr:hypothetical protein [Sphingomonadaceae bacterium]
MSSSSVTSSDGTVTVTTSDDGPSTPPVLPELARSHTVGIDSGPSSFTVGVHSEKPLDGASFIAGLMLGALLYFIIQTAMRWHARREIRSTKRAAAIGPQTDARDQDGMAAAVAALARRTATLETIVTDPAQRTAREIEALR